MTSFCPALPVVGLLLQLFELLHPGVDRGRLGVLRRELEDLLEEVAGQVLAVLVVEAERLHVQAVGVGVEALEGGGGGGRARTNMRQHKQHLMYLLQ